MTKALALDLEKLQTRAFDRADWAEGCLRRYYAAAAKLDASTVLPLRGLYDWMFVPPTLWPFNIQDVLEDSGAFNIRSCFVIPSMARIPVGFKGTECPQRVSLLQRGSARSRAETRGLPHEITLIDGSSDSLLSGWRWRRKAGGGWRNDLSEAARRSGAANDRCSLWCK
ncbi:MAG TPA: hypothetical protein VMA13_09165 [Candidatus Saccharimonadales bacterium]|nr:hypothetical protein [Candidatus Saccharimonadales bacterium]